MVEIILAASAVSKEHLEARMRAYARVQALKARIAEHKQEYVEGLIGSFQKGARK